MSSETITDGRIWQVTYYGEPMWLTGEEYGALKRLAVDDPVSVDRVAREYLARETAERPASRGSLDVE